MTEAKRLSQLVIKFLANRKGFDDWWDTIDKPTRAELEADLEELLANTIPEHPLPTKK
jgi:hypothetical protein